MRPLKTNKIIKSNNDMRRGDKNLRLLDLQYCVFPVEELSVIYLSIKGIRKSRAITALFAPNFCVHLNEIRVVLVSKNEH